MIFLEYFPEKLYIINVNSGASLRSVLGGIG